MFLSLNKQSAPEPSLDVYVDARSTVPIVTAHYMQLIALFKWRICLLVPALGFATNQVKLMRLPASATGTG